METEKDTPELRKKRLVSARRFLYLIIALLAVSAAVNYYIVSSTSNQIYNSAAATPSKNFCLVLGANPYSDACRNRLKAAAALYSAGKVKHIIVSGDNRKRDYNEPQQMYRQLLKLGVPQDKITLDYAGFRTLDSVYRARHVFDARQVVIVTQPFHLNRSLYLASSVGLEAVGFTAAETDFKSYNETREKGARLMAFIDAMIGRKAKFTGPYEPIVIE